MKKWIGLILLVLISAIGGLWYLGGSIRRAPTAVTGSLALVGAAPTIELPRPAPRPVEDRNQNGTADWEEEFYAGQKTTAREPIVGVVFDALKAKRAPLLPIEVLPDAPSRVYELADLRLGDSNTRDALTTYGRRLMAIMSRYRSPGLGHELALLAQAVENSQPENLSGLVAAATRYQTTLDELLALVVPSDLGQIHLNLLNALNRLAENAKLMAKLEAEPIIALGAAELQPRRLRQALSAIGNVNLFFASHNLDLADPANGFTLAIEL